MLTLSHFKVDITPCAGEPIYFGITEKERNPSLRDPLYMRGFILDDQGIRVCIASLDYCSILNSAHSEMQSSLAGALGICADQVIIHCIHQHDAPVLNFEMTELLNKSGYSRTWWSNVCETCAMHAKNALTRSIQISAVRCRETRLSGYASNRRILSRKGKCTGVRWSRCADETIRNAPAGLIDPMLRTAAFFDTDNKPAAVMHFYSTHPQTASGRFSFSADAPGEALRLLNTEFPDLPQAYMTGAGGNVTAGKYSSPTDLEGNLLHFGKLLYSGMKSNLNSIINDSPPECASGGVSISWKTISFPFPRDNAKKKVLEKIIRNPKSSESDLFRAAFLLPCYTHPMNKLYRINILSAGNIQMLFCGGELFIEYQLFVQSCIPDQFIACVQNCNGSFVYLPTGSGFAEGGYEPTYAWTTPAFENRFKKAVAEAVNTGNASKT